MRVHYTKLITLLLSATMHCSTRARVSTDDITHIVTGRSCMLAVKALIRISLRYKFP